MEPNQVRHVLARFRHSRSHGIMICLRQSRAFRRCGKETENASNEIRHRVGVDASASRRTLAARFSFRLALGGGCEQQPDELSLPVRPGLFEDTREMGLGRADRNAAS